MMVRFRGREVPIKQAGEAFIRCWEASERSHLKALIFRIPLVYDPPTKSGFVREHDLNALLTNELVYRIFAMPKVGIRKSFVEAWDELSEECFDGNDLVSFEPVQQDIVEWARRKGYFIEFDELEVVDDACRKAG
jgi:hypothetical protein